MQTSPTNFQTSRQTYLRIVFTMEANGPRKAKSEARLGKPRRTLFSRFFWKRAVPRMSRQFVSPRRSAIDRSQRFNICALRICRGYGRPSRPSGTIPVTLVFTAVPGERFRGGKRTLNPDASTTIYIFVSLSEMPCSRLYIPIPVLTFSFTGG